MNNSPKYTMKCPKCQEELKAHNSAKCSNCKRRHHTTCMVQVKKLCSRKRFCSACHPVPPQRPYKMEEDPAKTKSPAQSGATTPVHPPLYHQPITVAKSRKQTEPQRPHYSEVTAPTDRSQDPVEITPSHKRHISAADSLSDKLDQITRQVGKLSSAMSTLQHENTRLREDNETLKLAISKLCIRPCDSECGGLCSKREEKPTRPNESCTTCPYNKKEKQIHSPTDSEDIGPNQNLREAESNYPTPSNRREEEHYYPDVYIHEPLCYSKKKHSLCYSTSDSEPRERSDQGRWYNVSSDEQNPTFRSKPYSTYENDYSKPKEDKLCNKSCDYDCAKTKKIPHYEDTWEFGEPRSKQPVRSRKQLETSDLNILNVDPCIMHNGLDHKTNSYNLMRNKDKSLQLVIRRGQPFKLKIYLNRHYNEVTDKISFIIYHELATQPTIGRKTLVVMPLLQTEQNSNTEWNTVFLKSEENIITVQVTPSADAIIGKWVLEIEASVKTDISNTHSTYRNKYFIYILFNPWCKEDVVYMNEDSLREEYVLTEVGMMWLGRDYNQIIKMWKYGQFDEDVLDCSLLLLHNMSNISLAKCNDPVMVARAIVATLNSNDGRGVLVGNWTKDFSGGKSPTEWIGSQKILRKYFHSRKPIKYGDCFVFAGVATTVFRALGIPARTITCFRTAHDYGCSLQIDLIIDDDAAILPSVSEDTIWNHHAWTDIWTKRPDLGTKFDGWQTVDATPQKMDGNLYRVGPASVNAVKEGNIKSTFDVAFVHSEINADVIYWKYQGESRPLKLISSSDSSGIGFLISTKAVGSVKREDVTQLYKYKQKSAQERQAFLATIKHIDGVTSRFEIGEELNDLKFEFRQQNEFNIGTSYSVNLYVKNANTTTDYNVNITIRIESQSSTGGTINSVKFFERRMTVGANSEEIMTVVLNYHDYAPYMWVECVFKVYSLCKLIGSNYEHFLQEILQINFPSINIRLEGIPTANETLYGSAFFNNPLSEKLRNCVFLIEGPGIQKSLKYQIDDVPPDGIAKVNFKMVPTLIGKHTIIAKFISINLPSIDGYLEIEVAEGEIIT